MNPQDESSLFDTLTEAEVTSIAKIIVSLAAKFAQKFPFLVADDLIQDGWKEIIRYQTYFDPAKGKLTSWVYMVVQDIFTSIAQKEYNKTQKWEDIEGHVFKDTTVSDPCHQVALLDMIVTLQKTLSPVCFKYLLELEKNPQICLNTLSQILGLSERDLSYLRDELRSTTEHIMGRAYE
jgi:DNA-directed RNA polymerase specialized sigma24 family protein